MCGFSIFKRNYDVLKSKCLCFLLNKNISFNGKFSHQTNLLLHELKVKRWRVGSHKRKKQCTFCNVLFCSKEIFLILFSMDFLGLLTDGGVGAFWPSSLMMRLGTVIPYLRKTQKIYINHVTHPLSSAGIRIYSPEISKFYYIKKTGIDWILIHNL